MLKNISILTQENSKMHAQTGSNIHKVMSIASVCVLAVLAFWSISTVSLTQVPAVVQPALTYSLSVDERGRYNWSIADGSRATNQALMTAAAVSFGRDDALSVTLASGLVTGSSVTQGQVVATFASSALQQQQEELKAQLAALVASKSLLLAGGTRAAVEEATEKVRLAVASYNKGKPEVARLEVLSSTGVVSAQELEGAHLSQAVKLAKVSVARRGREAIESGARPEAIAQVDAEIVGITSQLNAVELRLGQSRVMSPISGIIEVGGVGTLLRVYNLDTAYVRFALSEYDMTAVQVGDKVRYMSRSQEVDGEVVEIAHAATFDGAQTQFYVTARLASSLGLRPGISGIVKLKSRRTPNVFGRLSHLLKGFSG
jgi:hypothetical protein